MKKKTEALFRSGERVRSLRPGDHYAEGVVVGVQFKSGFHYHVLLEAAQRIVERREGELEGVW